MISVKPDSEMSHVAIHSVQCHILSLQTLAAKSPLPSLCNKHLQHSPAMRRRETGSHRQFCLISYLETLRTCFSAFTSANMCWYIQPIKAQSILQPVLDLEKALKVFELDLEAVVETVHTN